MSTYELIMTTSTSKKYGEAIFGAAILALGLFIGIETSNFAAAPKFVVVGPKIFPYIIASCLVVIGLSCLITAFISPAEDDGIEHDLKPIVIIAAALLVEMFLLPIVGWIPAAAILFVLIARAFGSPSWVKDILFGVGLSGLTFVIFNLVLGLGLPLGSVIDSLLPAQ